MQPTDEGFWLDVVIITGTGTFVPYVTGINNNGFMYPSYQSDYWEQGIRPVITIQSSLLGL